MENGICSIKMAPCTPMNLTGTTYHKASGEMADDEWVF